MNRKNEKGFALVLSLVLLMAMSLMGGALIVISASDHQSNNVSDEYQQTFYVAETALYEGEKSSEIFLGLTQGAKILYFFDNFISSLSSVVNNISVNNFDFFATKKVCSINFFFLSKIWNFSPYKIWEVTSELEEGFRFIFPLGLLKKLFFT